MQNDTSLYLHADLQNFRPSEETYLFFGKRGSGKTTVRLSMMRTYSATNVELKAAGKPQHFVVDLCKPGHMTACLKDFQVWLLLSQLLYPTSLNPPASTTPLWAAHRLSTSAEWHATFNYIACLHSAAWYGLCAWNACFRHAQCTGLLGL